MLAAPLAATRLLAPRPPTLTRSVCLPARPRRELEQKAREEKEREREERKRQVGEGGGGDCAPKPPAECRARSTHPTACLAPIITPPRPLSQERKNREAFRELLGRHRDEGVINAGTRWKDYLVVVSKEPAYEAVDRNTSGSRPRELFEVRSAEGGGTAPRAPAPKALARAQMLRPACSSQTGCWARTSSTRPSSKAATWNMLQTGRRADD